MCHFKKISPDLRFKDKVTNLKTVAKCLITVIIFNMQIVKEIWEKCKSKEVVLSLIIILFGTLSFGLGRLSKTYESRNSPSLMIPKDMVEKVTIEKITNNEGKLSASVTESLPGNTNDKSGVVVASKTGKKYHLPWCAGAKSIGEDNKIWFNSIDEARKAGYTPALNCKGLE
jgi:hypothetical protein